MDTRTLPNAIENVAKKKIFHYETALRYCDLNMQMPRGKLMASIADNWATCASIILELFNLKKCF